MQTGNKAFVDSQAMPIFSSDARDRFAFVYLPPFLLGRIRTTIAIITQLVIQQIANPLLQTPITQKRRSNRTKPLTPAAQPHANGSRYTTAIDI